MQPPSVTPPATNPPAPPVPTAPTPAQTQASIVAGVTSATDLRVDALEGKVANLEKTINKHHNEQRNVIIGAIFACLLIVVTVAAEVVMFNGDFRNSLDQTQDNQRDDYKSLQEEINRTRDSLNESLIQVKTNQPTQTNP